jgi:HD-like signal output (HDOD) protein
MYSNWDRVVSNTRLISLPEAYLQLKEVLLQKNFSMADVAVPINTDPALTARLLRLVNSAFYGLSGKIDTVFRAVTMIGTQQVNDLVLSTAVAQTFDGVDNQVMDMVSFWKHSVTCGLTAKNLAKASNVKDSERLFGAGLLHDIGHLIMYQSVPELSQQCILQAFKSDQPLYRVERELIGFDYAKVGGALLQQWQMPTSLCEAVEFHLQPDQALVSSRDAFLVHIAKAMIAEDFEIKYLHPDSLEVSGLSKDQIMAVREQTEQDVAEVLDSLFPHH